MKFSIQADITVIIRVEFVGEVEPFQNGFRYIQQTIILFFRDNYRAKQYNKLKERLFIYGYECELKLTI